MRRYFTIMLALLATCSHVEQQRYATILEEKGFDGMKARLVPDVIAAGEGVNAVLGISKPNSFILVDGRGEFCLATIESPGALRAEPVIAGFPPAGCTDFRTDGTTPIAWAKRGRAFYALDIEDKLARRVVVSHDGDEEIIDSYLGDAESAKFMIRVVHHGWTSRDTRFFFVVYDLHADKILARTDSGGSVYPLGGGVVLHDGRRWDDSQQRTVYNWCVSGIDLADTSSNSVTELLNQLQLKIARGKRSVSPEHRMLIGVQSTGERRARFAVRWEGKFKDAHGDSLTVQIPKEYRLSNFVWFCPHAPWVKGLIYRPLVSCS
jgi:hypothetical protein